MQCISTNVAIKMQKIVIISAMDRMRQHFFKNYVSQQIFMNLLLKGHVNKDYTYLFIFCGVLWSYMKIHAIESVAS